MLEKGSLLITYILFGYRYASVFDRGSSRPGYQDVIVGDDLGDDQWHQIDIERHGNHVTIILDITRKYLTSRKLRKYLDINLDISVGGLQPRTTKSPGDSSLPKVSLTGVIFKGCMEDVTYDKTNILRETKEKSKYVHVIGNLQSKCSEDFEYFPPATLTTPASYIQLNITGKQSLNLKLKFRTFEHTGILVHQRFGSPDNGRLLLELIQGKLRLKLSSKILNIQVNLSPKTPSLTNGLWHKIQLNFSHSGIAIQVNSDIVQRVLNFSNESAALLFQNTVLKIGSALPGKSAIIGCVKEIHLNGKENVMVDSAMAKDVDIDKCYLTDRCFSSPCLHNGRCSQYKNTAQCDCAGTGHQGLRCENASDEHLRTMATTRSTYSFETRSSVARLLKIKPTRSITRFTPTTLHSFPTELPSSIPKLLPFTSNIGSEKVRLASTPTISQNMASSSSKKPVLTVRSTVSISHLTHTTTSINAKFLVNTNFQPTTAILVTKTVSPLPTTVRPLHESSVRVITPTTEKTTRKSVHRIIIIEKRNEITTVFNKNRLLVYLFLCIVFVLFVSLIVIISVKISRLALCKCLKRSSLSSRGESLSSQDSMELDQQKAKEDAVEVKQRKSKSKRPSSLNDSGIDRCSDSGVASNRSSAEVIEEKIEESRDSEVRIDCEDLDNSDADSMKGFLVFQEDPSLYTQQSFGWTALEGSPTLHHSRISIEEIQTVNPLSSQSDESFQNENPKDIATVFEDDAEKRHKRAMRYRQLDNDDSSSLENVYIEQRGNKISEEAEYL